MLRGLPPRGAGQSGCQLHRCGEFVPWYAVEALIRFFHQSGGLQGFQVAEHILVMAVQMSCEGTYADTADLVEFLQKLKTLSRVMKKGSLVGETPEIANDFVIPAEAGIQAFPQPIDIKAQNTGPRLSPG